MSNSTVVSGGDGALPHLNEEFSTPTSETKSKTNVAKVKLLAMLLLGIIVMLAGLMFFGRSKTTTAPAATPATLQKATYEIKNAAIDNESIGDQKERIRKAEEARQVALEAAEREAAEREEAEKRARFLAGLEPPQAGDTGEGQEATPDDAVQRRLRAGVLVPTSGGVYNPVAGNDTQSLGQAGGNDGYVGPVGFPTSDADRESWKENEIARRMKAAGLISNDMGGAFDGGGMLGAAAGAGGGVASRLRTARLTAVSADRLGNLDFILKKGTVIPCALVTGIDTQLSGFTLCRTIKDVYSANNKTLLVERGATFFGEQTTALSRGQFRTFVAWSRGDNPNGVTFDLDSPGVDSLGYSGIPGVVDRHLMERFGGAILISIIDDFAKAAAQKIANRNGNRVTVGSSSAESAVSIAEKTLDESINIPTTLIVKPGTVIYILAARDVSFEGVYDLVK
ncbi:MAG: hypothetical protein LBE22_00610 [Azoarcus sp.]|jgi:type IV secretion system protein VirB10|nr:hypothetical protein [Azoarcus sp.]